MSETLVKCDKCGTKIEKSKVIIDKGADYPELIKKAKEEGKDHLELCYDCANVESAEEKDFDDELSDIRKML